jgi:hypothetical protein
MGQRSTPAGRALHESGSPGPEIAAFPAAAALHVLACFLKEPTRSDVEDHRGRDRVPERVASDPEAR